MVMFNLPSKSYIYGTRICLQLPVSNEMLLPETQWSRFLHLKKRSSLEHQRYMLQHQKSYSSEGTIITNEHAGLQF